MIGNDLIALLPMIVIASTSVLVMLGIATHRSHSFTAALTLYGLYLSLLSLAVSYPEAPRRVTPLLVVDDFALLYMALILVSCLITVILSFVYLRELAVNREEFYLLLLLSTLGSMVLVCSGHLASFFLGLELLSISLYTLVAYPKSSKKHGEAGMKYLVLAAVSSAFLLFGMALVYADSGSMELSSIASKLLRGTDYPLPLTGGLMLILVGIGFKLALVPFHMWTPDVYEGAPAPVTAFIATVSKGAVFALLLRYFTLIDVQNSSSMFSIFALLAVASMIIGNLLALFQDNIKRILAYSSIAHMGYLLVAFLSGGIAGAQIVTFYLVTYFITTFGAFGIITLLSGPEGDADDLGLYRGLAWRRPVVAAVFTVMLFSLAGIPLTAGFIGKFYLISAGASSELWMLVVTLAIGSVIGLFYYLRVIVGIYAPPEQEQAPLPAVPLAGGLVLAALTLLLIWIGVYPGPLIEGIKSVIVKFS